MTLEEQIAAQIQRVETLQKDLIERGAKPEDARRPEELKADRVAVLRRTIVDLEKQKQETIARYDEEIEARKRELKGLDKTSDVDFVLRQYSGPRPPAGRKTTKKST